LSVNPHRNLLPGLSGGIQEKEFRILILNKRKHKIPTKFLPWREVFFFYDASRRAVVNSVIYNSVRHASLA
jgi:hypothetical protein